MPVRSSEATWRGDLQDGEGEMALGSGAWRGGYSFRSRFHEDEPSQSNPEELLAAAHSGCFSMSLANLLQQEGYEPERVHVTAECHLEMDESAGPTITRVHLSADVDVADVGDEEFQTIATEAKDGCPVSRALGGVDITLDASR